MDNIWSKILTLKKRNLFSLKLFFFLSFFILMKSYHSPKLKSWKRFYFTCVHRLYSYMYRIYLLYIYVPLYKINVMKTDFMLCKGLTGISNSHIKVDILGNLDWSPWVQWLLLLYAILLRFSMFCKHSH